MGELSGGQRQGVAIARAMHFKSKVMILDEPTNHLSVKETNKVIGFVRGLKEQGVTGVFISHNMHHVFECCDRVVAMARGEMVLDKRIGDDLDRRGRRHFVAEAGMTDLSKRVVLLTGGLGSLGRAQAAALAKAGARVLLLDRPEIGEGPQIAASLAKRRKGQHFLRRLRSQPACRGRGCDQGAGRQRKAGSTS